jgi:purine nucleosidase
LTNIAKAIEKEPKIIDYVNRVYVMSGSFAHQGNISPTAEANAYNDPHAAALVFNARWPVTMLPLNVTHTINIDAEYLSKLGKLNNVGKFM